jgi:Tol biopolymer transport system component
VAVADGSVEVTKTIEYAGPGSGSPSLSPDGRFLAYHNADSAGSARDIFLVSTDGRQEVRIDHPADDRAPLFSPDGSGLVFQSDRRGGNVWFLPISEGRPAGEARVLWDDLGPGGSLMQFAANGSLFYTKSGNAWQIYTVPIDLVRRFVGTPELLPPRNGERNNAPAFSPDGRFLAHLRGAGRRLVLRNLASGVEREFPLVAGTLDGASVNFCPDGRSLIVEGWERGSGRNRGAVVYRVDVQLGGSELLDFAHEPFMPIVCVNGDSRELVYLAPRNPSTDGASRVIRRSLVTGAATTLYDGATRGVTRSRDGSMIGFTARVDGEDQEMVMPSRGGSAATVATVAGKITGRPMWLPNGNGLLVVKASDSQSPGEVSPEVTLWRVPFDGAPQTEVGRVRLPPYQNADFGAGHFSLDPEGTHVAFERHAGTFAQVWAIDNLLPFIQGGASSPQKRQQR